MLPYFNQGQSFILEITTLSFVAAYLPLLGFVESAKTLWTTVPVAAVDFYVNTIKHKKVNHKRSFDGLEFVRDTQLIEFIGELNLWLRWSINTAVCSVALTAAVVVLALINTAFEFAKPFPTPVTSNYSGCSCLSWSASCGVTALLAAILIVRPARPYFKWLPANGASLFCFLHFRPLGGNATRFIGATVGTITAFFGFFNKRFKRCPANRASAYLNFVVIVVLSHALFRAKPGTLHSGADNLIFIPAILTYLDNPAVSLYFLHAFFGAILFAANLRRIQFYLFPTFGTFDYLFIHSINKNPADSGRLLLSRQQWEPTGLIDMIALFGLFATVSPLLPRHRYYTIELSRMVTAHGR